MKRIEKVVILLGAAALLAACGGSKEVVHDASDVLNSIRKSYRSTPNLTMKGTMKVTGVPATIWFETLVRRYDSLKMVLNGPFGIDIGALASTKDNFTFLELFQENVVYEGVPNRETFARSMQLGLGYDEIVALMRCEVPHIPTAAEISKGTLTIENMGDKIRYIIPQGSITESFTVDPNKLVITEYVLTRTVGADETTDLAVTYDDFYIDAGGRTFPAKATAVLADGKQTLRLSLDKVYDRIDEESTMTLSIPAGMERRRL